LSLDWETSLSRAAGKVPIDPHVALVPAEMIERVIATRKMRVCNACKSGKQKTVVNRTVTLVHLENANSDCQPPKLEIALIAACHHTGLAGTAKLSLFCLTRTPAS
jgi:hypothetical protein